MTCKCVSVTIPPQWEELLSNLLFECGAEGVSIEDPRDLYHRKMQDKDNMGCDLMPPAIDAPIVVKGFFPVENWTETESVLQQQLQALLAGSGDNYTYTAEEIKDEQWADAWKEFYQTEKLGERIVVKPTWETYQAADEEIIIELDPGMAFGTGGHATTKNCLRLLEKESLAGKKVLDIGTGSGILAICSGKLGADSVLAVDIDADAVKIAAENIAQNSVQNKVTAMCGDLLETVTGQYDVIIANIVADVIIKLLETIEQFLNENGIFIISGIIDTREEDVQSAIAKTSLTVKEIVREDGWVAMSLCK